MILKIVLAYIAVTGGPLTHEYCARFVGSYLACPPEIDHQTVVVCNGGPLPTETALLFQHLPCLFFPRANDPGYDISAYMDVALKFDCDLFMACGETIYFHKRGWLRRYVEEWNRYGPGMYGTFTSRLVRPHLNTTGFCVDPRFLRGGFRPQNRKDRYEFEHGERSMWKRIQSLGGQTRLVTFDGCYNVDQWRYPQNILWRGDQSNCLMWCSHCDRYFAQDDKTRKEWQRGADGFSKRI